MPGYDDDDDYDDYDSDEDYDDEDYDGGISGQQRVAAPAPQQLPRFRAQLTARSAVSAAAGDVGGGNTWSAMQQQQRQLEDQQLAVTLAQRQLLDSIQNRCDRPGDIIDKLLGGGLDLNQPMKNGWTALMLAAERGHGDMVSALLQRGAGVDFVSRDGATCLMAACGNRHCQEDAVLATVQMLLDAGAAATLHTVSASHGSALHLAARANFPRVVARLLAAGASANCPAGSEGRTPLMEAAARGNLRSAEALLAAGGSAAASARDRRGHTASELAANAGYARLARLIDAPAGELAAALAGGADGDADVNGEATTAAASGEYGTMDELTGFFCGIGYPEVAQQFRAHDLTFVDLLTTTEAALERIGVKKVGARRRILEAVRQLHRRPWRDTSLPQLATGRAPAPSDYLAILGNVHKHLEVMNATLHYLADHADAAAAEAAADAAAAAAAVDADAVAGSGPADGLRNPRVLARARNFCRLAGAESRLMLARLDATLVALNRLRPAARPDLLPTAPTEATAPPGSACRRFPVKVAIGAAAAITAFVLVSRRA